MPLTLHLKSPTQGGGRGWAGGRDGGGGNPALPPRVHDWKQNTASRGCQLLLQGTGWPTQQMFWILTSDYQHVHIIISKLNKKLQQLYKTVKDSLEKSKAKSTWSNRTPLNKHRLSNENGRLLITRDSAGPSRRWGYVICKYHRYHKRVSNQALEVFFHPWLM